MEGPSPLVRDLGDGEAALWDAYARSHPRATLFHLTAWKRVLETAFSYRPHYLLAEREGRACGLLPLFLCRTVRGERGLYSLPHTVYGGPVGDDRQAEEALLEAARDLARKRRAARVELRNRHASLLDLPRLPGFVTFEKELPDSADEVYRTFPKKAREAINQARKRHKLAAEFESDLDLFYDLLAASYHRLGTPVFPRRMFAAMLEQYGEDATILVVRHEGEPVSCVLSIRHRQTMHPLYSGEAVGVRDLKSNNFKYYRLMELAVERGLRRLDFGRSRADNEGTVKFKRNQGFEAEELPYQLGLPDGGEVEAASPNRGIYRRARKVWTRLPESLARRLGPSVVKYFP
jgi:FemAB-related protein (PEP-CTERM system-associated)